MHLIILVCLIFHFKTSLYLQKMLMLAVQNSKVNLLIQLQTVYFTDILLIVTVYFTEKVISSVPNKTVKVII